MDIPVSTTIDSSLFSLQAARDLLTALQTQTQAQSSETPVAFNQVLDSTRSITDTVEVGTTAQTATLDPTSSLLFQAHSGVLAASQAAAARSDSVLSADQMSQFMVTGVSASVATAPFANGQAPQSEDFRSELGGLAATASSRYPAAAGAADLTATYNSLRGAGRMNPPIGTGVDLKG